MYDTAIQNCFMNSSGKLSKGAVYFLKQRGIVVIPHGEEMPLLTAVDVKYISSYSEEYRHACEVVSMIRMGDWERKNLFEKIPQSRRQRLINDINAELDSRFVYVSLNDTELKEAAKDEKPRQPGLRHG